MTLDERIVSRLKDGPARLEVLATYCAATRATVAKALRRLKYAGLARSNLAAPYWNWHATPGCQCDDKHCKWFRGEAAK